MVRHAANAIRLTTEVAGDGREIGVELGTHIGIKEWVTCLRAEGDVDDNEAQ